MRGLKVLAGIIVIFSVFQIFGSVPATKQIYRLPAVTGYLCLDASKYTAKMNDWVVNQTDPTYWYDGTPIAKPTRNFVNILMNSVDPNGWNMWGHHANAAYGPAISYYIYVPQTCNVQIYTYLYFAEGNSIYTEWDDDPATARYIGNGGTHQKWFWWAMAAPISKVAERGPGGYPPYYADPTNYVENTAVLTPGVHKLTIHPRERGCCIGQILLRVNNTNSPAPPVDVGNMADFSTAGPAWPTEATADTTYVYSVQNPGISLPVPTVTMSGGIFFDDIGVMAKMCTTITVHIQPPADASLIRGYILHVGDVFSNMYNQDSLDTHKEQEMRVWKNNTAVRLGKINLQYRDVYRWASVRAFSFDEMYTMSTDSSNFGSLFIDSIPVLTKNYANLQAPNVGIRQIATVKNVDAGMWLSYPSISKGLSTIRFGLGRQNLQQQVSLGVYDLKGRAVRNLYSGLAANESNSVMWDGQDGNRELASGRYFYRLQAGDRVMAKPVIFVR